jgi:[acyl-carrier-protein] S-malonyltransferase
MSKTAFLFPGQGSQKAGMGKSSAEAFAEAREVFDRADHALGFSLSKLCFEGPEEELQLTENTQPAILATSVALFRVLASRGLTPDFVAGHSLGEYSALVSVDSLQLEDALTLVRKRGRYMQEAVPVGVGAMAALLGLSAEAVKEICQEVAGDQVVEPANFNGGGQVVIAGHREAVDRVSGLAKERGARRAVALPVSAPFHCRLMRPAAERLALDLKDATFNDLSAPLVNNVDAASIRKGTEARDGLERQVASPVRWEESIVRLLNDGVTRFVEVGPGKVLTGLVRKVDRQVRVASVEDPAGVEKVLEETGEN